MTRLTPLGQARIGLVQFPGSNCDRDCIEVFRQELGIELLPIWHASSDLPAIDALILPGGFSYGDYLRGGALAAHANIHGSIRSFAAAGGPILGICNGFQILTEMKLLPGTLMPNKNGQFVCRPVDLAVQDGVSVYHKNLNDQILTMPVAHGEGCFYIDEPGLIQLADQGQILLRYCDRSGYVSENACPNGSIHQIAGITDKAGRILGMMPHPERAAKYFSGSQDGIGILQTFVELAL